MTQIIGQMLLVTDLKCRSLERSGSPRMLNLRQENLSEVYFPRVEIGCLVQENLPYRQPQL